MKTINTSTITNDTLLAYYMRFNNVNKIHVIQKSFSKEDSIQYAFKNDFMFDKPTDFDITIDTSSDYIKQAIHKTNRGITIEFDANVKAIYEHIVNDVIVITFNIHHKEINEVTKLYINFNIER
jgi:hypothetical protein